MHSTPRFEDEVFYAFCAFLLSYVYDFFQTVDSIRKDFAEYVERSTMAELTVDALYLFGFLAIIAAVMIDHFAK